MLGDEDLRAAQSGSRPALERITEQFWPIAFRVALAVLSDRVAAQDAAQDAMIALLRALPSLRSVHALPSYLRRTAARCAYRELRRRQREQPAMVEETPDLRWMGDDVLDLRQALADLRSDLRVPLLLHYGAGLTSEEIGHALGLPASSVRFRLMRARAGLRAAMSTDLGRGVPDAAR